MRHTRHEIPVLAFQEKRWARMSGRGLAGISVPDTADFMTKETLETLWPKLKPILLPYEGGASQLYVLDLPLSTLDEALKIFHQRAHPAVITMFNGVTIPPDKKRLLEPVTRAEILSVIRYKTQNIIRGMLYKGSEFDFWIHVNDDTVTFDAEFVFWADQFFPDSKKEKEHRATFNVLLSLAEKFRENHPESECVISASEVGDPREDRDQPWTYYW